MKSSISSECNKCSHDFHVDVAADQREIDCPNCSKIWDIDRENIFEACIFCRCRYFYRQKDFNQFFGCVVMSIGIVLVPISKGLSLPILALVDWILFRRTPFLGVCYKCRSEFRGFDLPASVENFKHFLAARFEENN